MRNNSVGVYHPSDGSLKVRMFELASTTSLREFATLSLPLDGSFVPTAVRFRSGPILALTFERPDGIC